MTVKAGILVRVQLSKLTQNWIKKFQSKFKGKLAKNFLGTFRKGGTEKRRRKRRKVSSFAMLKAFS